MANKSASPSAKNILADLGMNNYPKDWTIVRIDDLLDKKRGISVGVMYPGENDPNGIPLIRAGDIIFNQINSHPDFQITKEKHTEYLRTQLEGAELLITLVGDIGRCAIVPREMAGWNAARAIAVLRFVDPNDARFARFCLLSSPHQHLMNAWATTTVQATLNLKEIRQIPLPWPPKCQRSAITYILESLDDKIVLNRRMSETLKEIARALFKSWFVDFDPVRAKAARRDTGLLKEIADLFPNKLVDSEIGEIPEGWEVGSLGDVVEQLRDSENPQDNPDALFMHYSIPAYDTDQQPIIERGEAILSLKFAVPQGTILLSKLNPEIERVWFVDVQPGDRAICSTEFLVLRPRPPFARAYTYCLMSSRELRLYLEGMVTGTSKSHQRVQPSSILGITVPKPPKHLLDQFEQLAMSNLIKATACRREIKNLAALRDTLLPKLVSGELRIKDPEAFLRRTMP